MDCRPDRRPENEAGRGWRSGLPSPTLTAPRLQWETLQPRCRSRVTAPLAGKVDDLVPELYRPLSLAVAHARVGHAGRRLTQLRWISRPVREGDMAVLDP